MLFRAAGRCEPSTTISSETSLATTPHAHVCLILYQTATINFNFISLSALLTVSKNKFINNSSLDNLTIVKEIENNICLLKQMKTVFIEG